MTKAIGETNPGLNWEPTESELSGQLKGLLGDHYSEEIEARVRSYYRKPDGFRQVASILKELQTRLWTASENRVGQSDEQLRERFNIIKEDWIRSL